MNCTSLGKAKGLPFCNSKLLSALFPYRCPFCKRVTGKELICKKCARNLPSTQYFRYAIGGFPCTAALPYLEQYAGAVKDFKFRKRAYYAPALASLVVQAAARYYDMSKFDCVTCVPMHPKLQRKRRFNQSELLAVECAALMGIPYVSLLEKYKINPPQHSLKRSQRAGNVKGVFRVIDKTATQDKQVLLIDDIITGGHTLGECARLLKKAGCRAVSCAVVCTVVI